MSAKCDGVSEDQLRETYVSFQFPFSVTLRTCTPIMNGMGAYLTSHPFRTTPAISVRYPSSRFLFHHRSIYLFSASSLRYSSFPFFLSFLTPGNFRARKKKTKLIETENIRSCWSTRKKREKNRRARCSGVVPEGGILRAKSVSSKHLEAFIDVFSKLPSGRMILRWAFNKRLTIPFCTFSREFSENWGLGPA